MSKNSFRYLPHESSDTSVVVLEEAARATEAAFPGVKVRRSFPELPPVEGDAGRLRQVFANLLQNAAQAQGEGEVRLAAEVDGSGVRVRVERTGREEKSLESFRAE